jgi:hypothetical protein
MVFSSIAFLFLFLPATLVANHLLPRINVAALVWP